MTLGAAARSVAARDDSICLQLGAYRAVISRDADIRQQALVLRTKAFGQGKPDEDRFDADCLHGLVDSPPGQVKVAFRARLIPNASGLADTYTGQFYDLSPLTTLQGPFLDLGRVCQSDGPSDATALRLAWAALAAMVDGLGVRMLIGCSSFRGAQPEKHRSALAALRENHLGPVPLRPHRMSPTAIDLPRTGAGPASLPHLLRSYLNMGGWVSDHAVQDTQLDTLHVFTGLCVDAIPEPRKHRLRALAKLARSARPKPLDLAPAAP